MYEKLNTVRIGNKKIPIKCDFNALQIFQEEFGTLKEFEQKLIGIKPVLDKNGDPIYEIKDGAESMKFTTTEPNLRALAVALSVMTNEGRQQAEAQGESVDFDYKKAIEEADFSMIEVAVDLHNEYRRCFDRKKLKASTRTATKKSK